MNKRHHHQVSASLAPLKASISIGELARLTGFNARAIRYYEQMGVLPHSSCADNGYRSFCQEDVNRLHLLRRLRLLGICCLRQIVAGCYHRCELPRQENDPALGLRIFVAGGGCSGLQYGMTIDEEQEGDTPITQDDIKVFMELWSTITKEEYYDRT